MKEPVIGKCDGVGVLSDFLKSAQTTGPAWSGAKYGAIAYNGSGIGASVVIVVGQKTRFEFGYIGPNLENR